MDDELSSRSFQVALRRGRDMTSVVIDARSATQAAAQACARARQSLREVVSVVEIRDEEYRRDWPNEITKANRLSARATRAWLIGRGLAAEIQDLQGAGNESRLPAPGLFRAVRLMSDACAVACVAANSTFLLTGAPGEAPPKEAMDAALFATLHKTRESELWMHRIAALCLGVSAHLAGNDAVDRADRAAVFALTDGEEPATLADEGLWHVATTMEEFCVELAGDFCRLNIEHNSLLVIKPFEAKRDFILRCRFDERGDLTLTIERDVQFEGDLQLAPLLEMGWEEDAGAVTAFWHDPFTIREPIELIRETLVDYFKVASPDQLQVSVERLHAAWAD